MAHRDAHSHTPPQPRLAARFGRHAPSARGPPALADFHKPNALLVPHLAHMIPHMAHSPRGPALEIILCMRTSSCRSYADWHLQSYRRILRLTPRPPSRTEAVPLVRALATCPLPPTSAFSGSLHLATLADGRDDRVGRRGEVVGELCERGARLLTTHRVNGQGPEAGEESAHLPRGRMTDGSRQVTSSQTEPLLANANQFKSSKSSQVKTSEDK